MSKQSLNFLAALSLLMICSGCSVLTRTQVMEVNRFASAARDYGEMPGTVIGEHARIRKVRQVLSAASDFNGDTALDAIKIALAQQRELEERHRQANAALSVLNDYADLLVRLSSDQFITDLQGSAESLGRSIDNGIAQYNRDSGKKLTFFGSGVAAAVRGTGGVHIRREQEKALRDAVTSADPVVRSMTWTVEETMALYLDREQLSRIENLTQEPGQPPLTGGGLLTQEKNAVMDRYRKTAGRFEGKQPPSLPLTVADEMESADNAAALAARTIVAAQSYREAHARLVEMVASKRDLRGMIDEVQALEDEVEAAADLKSKLDR